METNQSNIESMCWCAAIALHRFGCHIYDTALMEFLPQMAHGGVKPFTIHWKIDSADFLAKDSIFFNSIHLKDKYRGNNSGKTPFTTIYPIYTKN